MPCSGFRRKRLKQGAVLPSAEKRSFVPAASAPAPSSGKVLRLGKIGIFDKALRLGKALSGTMAASGQNAFTDRSQDRPFKGRFDLTL